jgi:hypothetical protein
MLEIIFKLPASHLGQTKGIFIPLRNTNINSSTQYKRSTMRSSHMCRMCSMSMRSSSQFEASLEYLSVQ